MPNWCNNTLTVAGPLKDKETFKKKAKSDFMCPKDQRPKYLNLMALRRVAFPKLSKELLEEEMWAFDESEGHFWKNGALVYCFTSKWCAPLNEILNISRGFPLLKFSLRYDEPSNQFRGTFVCKNGQVLKETEVNY